MCRSCGAIVGAGELNCGVCGTATAFQPPTRQQQNVTPDRETLRFARAVLNRPYKFTITFLVANLFVFLLMWQSSGLANQVLLQGFSHEVLIAYGAKLNYLVAESRQWWRFVTPMFLHVNLIHLLVNMYGLWMIGPYVEKLYGSAKFVMFWVVAGIAGVVASYLTVRPNLATGSLSRFLFKATDDPSVGASGALFGLVGVLFVFGIKFRNELPEGFKRAFGTGLMPIILLNLFIGYIGRGFIDNAAHLGGLAAGAGMALVVQYRRPGDSQGNAIVWRVLQVASLGILVLSFFKVVQNFNIAPNRMQHGDMMQHDILLQYVDMMNRAHETVAAVLSEGDFSEVDSTVQKMLQVGAPDATSDEQRRRLIDLLTKAKTQLSASASPSQGSKPRAQLDQKLVEDLKKWKNDYEVWASSALKRVN
jgi:rhomboid protease GluP